MRVCLMAFSFCPLCIHLNFFFSLNTKALSLLRTVGLSSGASLKNTLKLLPLWTRLKFEILLVSLNVHVALQARDFSFVACKFTFRFDIFASQRFKQGVGCRYDLNALTTLDSDASQTGKLLTM